MSSHFESLRDGIIAGKTLQEINSESGMIIVRCKEKPQYMELQIRFTIDPETTRRELISGEYKTQGNWKELAKSRPDLIKVVENNEKKPPATFSFEGFSTFPIVDECTPFHFDKLGRGNVRNDF